MRYAIHTGAMRASDFGFFPVKEDRRDRTLAGFRRLNHVIPDA